MINIRQAKIGDRVIWNVKNIGGKIVRKYTDSDVARVILDDRDKPVNIHVSYLDKDEEIHPIHSPEV